ncbi:MAG: sigma-70 family RNA polymerase sigma factor [Planctomycetes bacterium]|nr:sigma-70 family RNA polymerase sigma factor [Planctomycetota bacterium]
MDARDQIPEELLRETDALRRVARGILFEPALAEDAVQEAWLAALRSQKREAHSGGWLTEAVRRIARGMRRQDSRRTRREHTVARNEAQPSAADSAARVELLRGLLDALESLEEPYRTAVQLRLLEDLQPRAIAERLGVPVETARTRVKRGIEKLRAQLDAENAQRRGEFLAALAPLALPGGWKLGVGAYAGSKAILGGVMSAQVKLASAAAVVLLVAGLLWTHPWRASVPEVEHAQAAAQPVSATAVAENQAASAQVETPAASPTTAATERRVLDANPSAWIVRGHTKLDHERPFPGAEIQIEVVAGYEGPGDVLRTETVHADNAGNFAVALAQPDRAVRIGLRGKMPGYLCYRNEQLVLRGAAAPQELQVGFLTLDLRLAGRVLDLQGAPISGAHVSGPGSRTVDTDAEGRFEIEGASAQRSARLDAWADGFSEGRTSVSIGASGRIENIELRLAPGLVLQGRVVDEAGLGIADARVRCFPLGHAETTTARDGNFTLKGLPSTPAWLSLGASAPGYGAQRQELREGHIPTEPIVLTLAKAIELTGQVQDESGQPLPGAALYTGSSRYDMDALRAIAGDEGRFVIHDVPRSTRELHAERSGFAPGERALVIPERGLFAPVRIALGHGLALSGIAVDAQQTPIPGLRVSVLHVREHEYIEGIETKTGPEGRFALTNLPKSDDLGIELFGTGFVRRLVAIDPAVQGEVRVVMARSAGLAGRVVDAANGKPVTSFRVRLVRGEAREGEPLLSGYESSWIEEGREFQDPDGRWSTKGEDLAPEQVAGIEIRASGYAPFIVGRALTTTSPETNPIETALSAGASLHGRVVDKRAGTPIAGALVRRFTGRDGRGPWEPRESDAREQTLTDSNGAFRFEGLAAGKLSLAVDAAGFAPLLEGPFEPGASEPTLELVAGATLRGVLKDGEGRTQAHATISVSAMGGSMGSLYRYWTLETDAEGRFELRDLMLAQYGISQELRVENTFVHDLTQQVVISEARAYEVELKPLGKCSLIGTIEIHGAPAALLTIQAWPAGGGASVGRGTLARDGQFTLEGLEPGHWRIQVWEPGSPQHARQASAEVDVAVGHVTTLTIGLVER